MNSTLGFFDSGVGGFTVLKRVLERHGEQSCLYLGDNARIPYGDKSVVEIRLIAEEVVTWLVGQQVQAIVMACNTTNSLAFDIVQRIAHVPVLELIGAAAGMISENKVGVLATPATAESGAYKNRIKKYRPNTDVWEQSCPSFVPLIESGQINSQKLRLAAQNYLSPLIDVGVEAVVLGCTHYPLLEPLLRQLLPSHVRVIDPAYEVAKQLDKLLGEPVQIEKKSVSFSNTRFCVTSDPLGFAVKSKAWLGKIPEVELVSLQS